MDQKKKKSGGLYGDVNCVYPYMGCTMAAYAARYYSDTHLAYQVWQVLVHSLAGKDKSEGFDSNQVEMTYNKKNLTEMFWISTNFTSQLLALLTRLLLKVLSSATKLPVTSHGWPHVTQNKLI